MSQISKISLLREEWIKLKRQISSDAFLEYASQDAISDRIVDLSRSLTLLCQTGRQQNHLQFCGK